MKAMYSGREDCPGSAVYARQRRGLGWFRPDLRVNAIDFSEA